MGKLYLLVFVISVIVVVYTINKRLQQKEKEKHLTDDDNE